MLLGAADDYLLELCRTDLEADWRADHPDGEVVTLDSVSPVRRVLQELQSPSLFSPTRLVVARNASDLFKKAGKTEAEELADALGKIRLVDVWLILAAEVDGVPEGPLADVVRRAGEVRFLPLPETPKPWEQARVSEAQKGVLTGIIRRVAPSLVDDREVIDALCEAYGFKPRLLAQAAQRLAVTGEVSAEAVRAQAGAAESLPRHIEDAIQARDRVKVARILAAVAAGGPLLNWRGEAVEPEGAGPFLVGVVGRLLRQALAMRSAAGQAGLEKELDVRRCASPAWYPRTFKGTIFPRLQAHLGKDEGSPLAGLSAWQMQRPFKVAAAYSDAELLRGIAELYRAGIERERRIEWVLASLGAMLLALTGPPQAGRRAAAG